MALFALAFAGASVSCKSMREVQRDQRVERATAKAQAETTKQENVSALDKIGQEKARLRRQKRTFEAGQNRDEKLTEALALLQAKQFGEVLAIVQPMIDANGEVVDEELTQEEMADVRSELPLNPDGSEPAMPEVDPIQAPAFSKERLALVLVISGTARSLQDDMDGAIADLRRAHEVDPTSREARKRLGKLLFGQEQYVEALDVWQKELEAGYRSGALLYDIAKANYRLARTDESQRYRLDVAKVAIDDAFLEDPGNLAIRKWRALLDYETGDYRSAIPKLERVVTDDPADVQYRKLLANCYLTLGDHGKAADTFEVLVQTGHADASVHYALVDLYRLLGLPDLAAEHVVAAYEGREVPASECLMVAQLLADARRADDSVEWLEKVKPTDGETYAKAVELQIFLFADRKRTDEAIAAYERAIDGDSAVSGDLHLLMGDLYLVAEQPKKAQSAYAMATGYEYTRAEGFAGQAEAYYATGLLDDAASHYRKAIDANPDEPRYKLLLQQVETDLEIQKAATSTTPQNG